MPWRQNFHNNFHWPCWVILPRPSIRRSQLQHLAMRDHFHWRRVHIHFVCISNHTCFTRILGTWQNLHQEDKLVSSFFVRFCLAGMYYLFIITVKTKDIILCIAVIRSFVELRPDFGFLSCMRSIPELCRCLLLDMCEGPTVIGIMVTTR